MKYSTYSLLFLLHLTAVVVHAQKSDPESKIDKELAQCLGKKENQTTVGMCECQYNALAKWDKELNASYKTLLTKLDSNAKARLVEAQRQWVKFKEKEMELVDATTPDGTYYLILRAERVTDITKKRALDLAFLLELLKEP